MTLSYYYAWHIEMEVKAGGRTNYIEMALGEIGALHSHSK